MDDLNNITYNTAINDGDVNGIGDTQVEMLDDSVNDETEISADQAYEKTGGFGLYQKWMIVLGSLANGGNCFFLYSFSFLEKEPVFKCQLDAPQSNVWTYGNETNTLKDDFCSNDYTC